MKKTSDKAIKKVLFCVVCVFMALTLLSCLSLSKENDDFATHIGIKSAQPVFGDIVNNVILICFKGENVDTVRNSFTSTVRNYFVGESNSLKDYYSTISYGSIEIETLFPESSGDIFVYQSSEYRSTYKSITQKATTKTRCRYETELLNGAINAANAHFDFDGKNLDTNNDGYVDSVSFLVSGKDSDGSDWGGLLWPHSWDLEDINAIVGTQPASLNGIKVNAYSFNFLQTVDVGFLCHETGHVFGMPDLYMYNTTNNSKQVEEWDIMHRNQTTPQYPTVYLRDKYLGVIGDNQIEDLKMDGEYSLKPVSTASAEDVLAYRVSVSEDETIYFEYRNNNVSVYDSMLSGSGLIVYRTNGKANGNMDGRPKNAQKPYEVYVFRPSVSSSDSTNLSKAYLSNTNKDFSHLGSQTSKVDYDSGNIFTSDGKNTGIIVKIISQSDDLITFEVGLNGYGSKKVTDLVVEGNTDIIYGAPLDVTVKLKFNGFSRYVIADPSTYVLEYDPELIGTQTATVIYTDDFGEKLTYYFTVTISDNIEVKDFNLTAEPDKTVYDVGERSIDLSGLTVVARYEKNGVLKTEEIKYRSEDADKWRVEGLNIDLSGEYEVKITYIPFGKSVFVTFTVTGNLKEIYVSEIDSLTVVGKKESLRLNVEGRNADGTVRKLTAEEYSVFGFSASATLYRPQTVTIEYKGDTHIKCTKTVYLVDETQLTDIKTEGAINTLYRYGEDLRLNGGKLVFCFGETEISVPAENYYSLYAEKFSSTKRGNQTLSVEHYGKTNSYSVTVFAVESDILVSNTETAVVNSLGGYVIFNGRTTFKKAVEYFGSYLNIRFVKTEGSVRYVLREGVHDETVMNKDIAIELVNDDGIAVLRFRVFVRGDITGDGEVNADDYDGWANALFRPTTEADICLDMNGDGKYTLTDYVLLKNYGGRNA